MIIDAAIIGLLFLGALYGWKKGLVRMISGWMGWLLVPYLAFRFAPILGDILNKNYGFTGKIAAFLAHHQALLKIGSIFNLLLMPFNFFIREVTGKGGAAAPETAAPAVLAVSLAKGIVFFLCVILLFFVAKWGLRLVGSIITRGLDHTLIGAVNHLAGGAVSLGVSFILLAVVLLITVRLAAGNAGTSDFWAYLNKAFDQSDLADILVQSFSGKVSTWVRFW